MSTQEFKLEVPDYFTSELFARDVMVTREWKLRPIRTNTAMASTFADIVIRDSGTWIPMKLFDLGDAWLLLWNRDKNHLRVPKVIQIEDCAAESIADHLTGFVLPAMNPYVSDALYTQGATLAAFCLYLHKHASDINVISQIPRFINVEPFRWKIIRQEKL